MRATGKERNDLEENELQASAVGRHTPSTTIDTQTWWSCGSIDQAIVDDDDFTVFSSDETAIPLVRWLDQQDSYALRSISHLTVCSNKKATVEDHEQFVNGPI
jgi:hypothetical protein